MEIDSFLSYINEHLSASQVFLFVQNEHLSTFQVITYDPLEIFKWLEANNIMFGNAVQIPIISESVAYFLLDIYVPKSNEETEGEMTSGDES